MNIIMEAREDATGNTYFCCTLKNDNGGSEIKYLSCTQFLEMLQNVCKSQRQHYPVGRLPEGYLDAYITSTEEKGIRIYVPEEKRCFLLSVPGEKIPRAFMIPMPSMLFDITFTPQHSPSGKCCIVCGSYTEVLEAYYSGTLIGYTYPFGNVSTDDGHICMGNIIVNMYTMMDAPKYITAFFDGVTNHDYLSNGSRVTTGLLQMELLGELQNRETFPYEWLFSNNFSFLKPLS